MTRFLLIRHAAVEGMEEKISGRLDGGSLTPRGREQARRLARLLAGERIGAVYSSPRERARETARLMAEALGGEVLTAPELDEIDYGEWSGRTIEELEPIPRWRAFNSIRSVTRIPGGESMIEAQARVVSFLEGACARYPADSVALVSHAEIVRAALAYCLGAPIDLMLRLAIDPASVSIVAIGERGPIVECVNQRGGIERPWN